MSAATIGMLIVIGLLGHVMALFWCVATRRGWRISRNTIYAITITSEQIRREFKNSMHTPIHAIIIGAFLLIGFFASPTWQAFVISLVLTTVWVEVWHYISHRILHTRGFYWIHAEHHKSFLSSPLTALSFSFTEKLIFNVGIVGVLAVVDLFYSLNAFGIGAWYIGYLIINSYSHENFEIKSQSFLKFAGKVLTSTTYHSLHHSRYTKNYGLGTRILDRIFKTEWDDYEQLFEQITGQGKPLNKLAERFDRTLAASKG